MICISGERVEIFPATKLKRTDGTFDLSRSGKGEGMWKGGAKVCRRVNEEGRVSGMTAVGAIHESFCGRCLGISWPLASEDPASASSELLLCNFKRQRRPYNVHTTRSLYRRRCSPHSPERKQRMMCRFEDFCGVAFA